MKHFFPLQVTIDAIAVALVWTAGFFRNTWPMLLVIALGVVFIGAYRTVAVLVICGAVIWMLVATVKRWGPQLERAIARVRQAMRIR